MNIPLENASSTEKNTSHSGVVITPLNVAISFFVLGSFLAGTTLNGLFLWVSGVKMKRTVNTLLFFHLILTYLVSSASMPFVAVFALLDYRWVFGTFLCKLINTFGSLGMFTTVFLLTIISLDRYLLICHPIWSQHNRTIPQAKRLILAVWLVSLVLSAPYMAFRETREVDGLIKCVNNYALSSAWDGTKIHLVFFVIRFLLAFLIPFIVIMNCYYWMGQEMKKKKLARSGKPYRVLLASVATFFIYWLPYHLHQGSVLLGGIPKIIVRAFLMLFYVGACFNYNFTPILYLFVGEKFQQVFKMSILSLLKRSFADDLTSRYVSEETPRPKPDVSTRPTEEATLGGGRRK